eukprot:SAG31_NODE_310_length_17887_cov_4.623060_10_plen_47_part_00
MKEEEEEDQHMDMEIAALFKHYDRDNDGAQKCCELNSAMWTHSLCF